MNLYLVSQDYNNEYDTFDAFVCRAESEEDARNICPGSFNTWCDIKYINVEYIGMALSTIQESKIILASFNAG